MAHLRTAFVFFIISIMMIILIIPGLLFAVLRVLGLRKPVSIVVYRLAQAWAKLLIWIAGCKFMVAGRENIPRTGGVCFASNHGSIVDIPLLLATTGRPAGFIAKKELSFIPLLNIWILLLGGLFLDRKNVRKAVGTIKTGVRRIENGAAMIIFPEGHRSRGEGLLPFHQGSFKLATQSGSPIVPVAITGSYETFEKTGLLQTTHLSITYLPAIVVTDFAVEDRRRAVAEKVRAAIAEELQKSVH
ncbi:MAG: 1-acyl-sn-glycerol-3-phosphate acyltransferase [Spirochaetaceae bacterium]|jgi:1-acyl-sn-glycerol-3-phosphate acyltransferase|nr:1-acyl-sn-glycerol-3-phosphate acyltransferase [Spirochaetaceae bacterium]